MNAMKKSDRLFSQEDRVREFERAVKLYTAQLDGLGSAMKKKTREDLLAGFKDGLSYGLNLTVRIAQVAMGEE